MIRKTAKLITLLCLVPVSANLHAQASTDPITPTAVAKSTLTFATEAFKIYELESSSDGTTWSKTGNWLVGDGTEQSFTITTTAGVTQYRVSPRELVNLNALLEGQRTAAGVPALAAVIIKNGEVHAIGATGNRRFDVAAPVTNFDKWHHGSLTKSMTATLAAKIVEEGLITWETTLAQVFPEKAGEFVGDWGSVTLSQLLSNISGAPGNLGVNDIWSQIWNFEGLPRDGRLFLIDLVTKHAPNNPPGTSYEYSNAGFSIAGAMLEKVTDTPWETLMQEKLFGPLEMETAGIGIPASPRYLLNPYGHSGTVAASTVWEPQRGADNPPAIGPSATAHANIIDMMRYVMLHLNGARDQAGLLLTPASFDKLHAATPVANYALGWLTGSWNGNGGGRSLSHTGSNTQWFTNVWIAPDANWACVVCMNFGGEQAFEKSDGVVVQLITNHGP